MLPHSIIGEEITMIVLIIYLTLSHDHSFLIYLTFKTKIPLIKQLLSIDVSPVVLVFSSADALNVHSPFLSLVIPLQVDSKFKINQLFTNVKHKNNLNL